MDWYASHMGMDETVFAIVDLEREKLKRICDERGVPRAARELGLARDSVLRVLAGQPVRKGTAMMIKAVLKEQL